MKTAPAALTGLPVYAFRVGQTYSTRIAGDADCVFSIVVLARSSATVSVRSNLCEVATLRVELWQGTEFVKVLPGYHQSPIISASSERHADAC
jgi:hypothetical protein